MRVIVTRPQPEAGRWVEALRARGIDAVALPLIDIAPPLDAGPLRQAWDRMPRFAAAMFVSGNAVQQFFAARPAGAPLPTQAWVTGPGTQEALRREGLADAAIVAPATDAAQLDSEALWQRAAALVHAGDRVLIVRGADAAGTASGRDWLAEQLHAAKVEVQTVAAYRRCAPHWSAEQLAVAREAARGTAWWLLSSSEAVANLVQALPGQTFEHARAVATHPRIADAARSAGFGEVRECRPGLDAMVASIESVR